MASSAERDKVASAAQCSLSVGETCKCSSPPYGDYICDLKATIRVAYC